MAFTMMATAGAAYTDQADIQATEAVDMLNAIGVMTGDPDGSFRPNDTITRAEACRMIYSIRTNSDDASAYANMQTTFKDVPADAWYAGYVKHCQAANIVSGTSATTFEPNRDVTGVELALMCLRVMGYDPAKADIGGSTWSTKTISLATEAGILDGVNTNITAACPRQWAAQIMYNMIQASTVRWSDDLNGYSNTYADGTKYETVGEKYMKLYTIVGTLTEVDTKNLSVSQSDSDVQDTDTAVRGIKSFSNLKQDYSSLLGQKVKVMIRDKKSNDVVGVYPNGDSTTYAVNASAVSKDDNKVKIDGTTYSVEYFGSDNSATVSNKATGDAIATYINGQVANGTTLTELDNNKLNPNQYTFVDTDGNGKIDTLVVKTFDVAKVTYAAADKIIANGKTYKFADDTIAQDIVKDDWIVITKNLYNDNNDIVKAELATGKLNGLRNDQKVTPYFDGGKVGAGTTYNEYQIGDTWYNGGDKLVQSAVSENDLNAVKAGEDVEYVAVNGIVFYVKKASGDAVGRVADVAMIIATDNTGVEDRAKIAFFNGTTATVDVDTVYTDNNGTEGTLSNLTPGVVYEYSVSGGKYSFEPLQSGIKDKKFEEYYGDLTYRTASNGDQLTTAKFGDGTLDSTNDLATFDDMKIDDNAQVLLYTTGTPGDSKQITGKQFKAMNHSKITGGSKVYAFSGDMNGLDRIGALAVTVSDFDGLIKTWNNYGYIMTKPSKTGSNTITYTVWTANGKVDVQEEKSNITDRDKGTVIGYNSLTEKDGVNVIDDVDKLTASDITFTAVTDSNAKTVQFAVAPVGADGAELDVAGTILYIDSNAANDLDIGVESGSIKDAQEDNGSYLANALVIGNDDEIELLIIDQGQFLKNDVYKANVNGTNVIYGETATAKTIATGSFAAATVGKASNETVNFTTKNIADGKAATVNVTSAIDGLTVSAAAVSNNKIAVTVSGTPTKSGTLKFTVTADSITSSEVSVTVNPADKTGVELVKEAIATAFNGNPDATGSKAAPYELTMVLTDATDVADSASFDINLAKYFEGYTLTAAQSNDMNGLDQGYGTSKYTLTQDSAKITIADKASDVAFANGDQFGIEFTVTEDATGTATKLYAMVTLDAATAVANAAQKVNNDLVATLTATSGSGTSFLDTATAVGSLENVVKLTKNVSSGADVGTVLSSAYDDTKVDVKVAAVEEADKPVDASNLTGTFEKASKVELNSAKTAVNVTAASVSGSSHWTAYTLTVTAKTVTGATTTPASVTYTVVVYGA